MPCIFAFVFACGTALTAVDHSAGRSATPHEITISTAEELHAIFAERVENLTVRLEPGEYRLTPSPYTDPTCGNCQEDAIDTPAQTTVGLHLRGTRIRIIGIEENDKRPVVHTNAGYGILIEDVDEAEIASLIITGGARSNDGNATDGAIVVRNASVTIRDNVIENNLGDPDVVSRTVSGVMGVVGRERSRMRIERNRIERNSWDGIALYRDAQATITGNIIDGVDAATGAALGGGRGVGVGITWNAIATVRGNRIANYWKGIGVFVDGRAVIERNIVEDILTWGIALWSAGENNASADIRWNVIHRTGACGISIASSSKREDAGTLAQNAVARTGQNPAYDPSDRYCHQCALAIHSKPEHFTIGENAFFANRRGSDDLPDHDVSEAEFRAAIAHLCRESAPHKALRDSAFMREFCHDHADEVE